eukprot:Gb_32370 [translate_table: standard]
MDAVLPLNFYCRNARLCLKKAAFSKKSQLYADELRHLKKFDALISGTIRCHPLYEEKKGDKQILELQDFLPETSRRIEELEAECIANKSQSRSRSRGHKSEKGSVKALAKSPGNSSENPYKSQKKAKPLSRTRVSPSKGENWDNWADNGADMQTSFSNSISSPTARRTFTGLETMKRETITLSRDGKSSSSGSKDSPYTVTVKSSDQRLDALHATQLYSKEGRDGRSELDIKNTYYASEGIVSSFSRKSPYSRVSESSRKVSDWNSSYEGQTRGSSAMQKDVLQDSTQKLATNPDVKEVGKEKFGVRKFRFSSESFEKRLQDKIKRLQSPFTDDEERMFSKCEESSDRRFEDIPEEGIPRGIPCNESRTSSPSNMLKKRTSLSMVQFQPLDRVNHSPLDESRYSDLDPRPAENSLMDGKLVPDPELNLETLGCTIQNGKGIKRDTMREELQVTDDVVCQSLGSDSCETYPTSLHHLQKLTEVSAKACHHLEREVTEISNTEGALGDSLEEISDDNAVSVSENALHGTQVEALEEKINSLQDLVGGLKGSIESFTMRVEEDGEMWQGKVEGVMNDLESLKDETQCELAGIKRSIKEELKLRLDELTRDLQKAEGLWEDTESLRESSTNLMDNKIKECSAKVDFLKKQVNSLLSETKTTIMKEMKEKLAGTANDVLDSLKTDLEAMEVGMSKELEAIRQEMDSRLELLRLDTEKNRAEELLETLVEERIDSKISLLKNTAMDCGEPETEGVKEELSMLWSDIQELLKGKEEIQGHVEQLAQMIEKTQENICKEQSIIKSEGGSLKKQLQHFRKETLQDKIANEDFRNEIRAEIDNFKMAFGKLKEETQNMKADFASKNEVEDGLNMERSNLFKALERIKESEMKRMADLEALKQAKEELEKSQGSSKFELTREKMLIMEKVENLSQLYLSGLEEVRSDLLIVKLSTQDRLGELENEWEEYKQKQASTSSLSLRELVLDSLETRVAHLENNMENKQEERQNLEKERLRIEHLVSLIEKDRKKIASAAIESSTSACKAAELLSEIQGSTLETRRKSTKLQESLDIEREMVAAAVSEARRLSADLDREKEIAIATLSEARIKSQEISEGLEHERSRLKIVLSEVEKERDVVTAAASEAEAAAAKAEEALADLTTIRRQSVHIHENLSQVVDLAVQKIQDKCSREIQTHMDDWRMSMSFEVLKAKSMTEELEEGNRKASLLMIEASPSNFDHEENTPSIDERLQRTEEELAYLSGTIQDNNQALQASLANQEEMQDRLQKSDHELKTLTRTVGQLNEYKEEDRKVILQTQRDLTQLVQKFDKLNGKKPDEGHVFPPSQKDIKDQFQKTHEKLIDLDRKVEDHSGRKGMQEIDNWLFRNEQGLAEIKMKLENLEHDNHENNQASLKKLEEQLERTDEELAHLSMAVDKLTGENQHEKMKTDVKNLHAKMEEVFETIAHLNSVIEGDGKDSLVHNICSLENKMLETAAEQSNLGKQISEVGRIVEDLESRQMGLLHSVEEIRINATDIENSTLELVPKIEAGVKIANELENRMLILENSIRQGTGNHGEVTVQIEKRQGMELLDNTLATGPIDSKILNLENRIEHVESTTVTSLRILDAKMEHFSVGVQTALEGAAMAESKCGALGAELVKVFRMLASSRRESPLKLHEGDDNNESGTSRTYNRKQQLRPDSSQAIKLKAPMSHAACSYCKKTNPKGGECGCRKKEVKEINVRLGQPEMSPTDFKDPKQLQDSHPDGSSRIRLKQPTESQRDQGSSEMRASETLINQTIVRAQTKDYPREETLSIPLKDSSIHCQNWSKMKWFEVKRKVGYPTFLPWAVEFVFIGQDSPSYVFQNITVGNQQKSSKSKLQRFEAKCGCFSKNLQSVISICLKHLPSNGSGSISLCSGFVIQHSHAAIRSSLKLVQLCITHPPDCFTSRRAADEGKMYKASTKCCRDPPQNKVLIVLDFVPASYCKEARRKILAR